MKTEDLYDIYIKIRGYMPIYERKSSLTILGLLPLSTLLYIIFGELFNLMGLCKALPDPAYLILIVK